MRFFLTLFLAVNAFLVHAQPVLKRFEFATPTERRDHPGGFAEMSDGTIVLLWTSYNLPNMDTCFVNARKISASGAAGIITKLDAFPIPPNTVYTIQPVAFPDKTFGFAYAIPQGSLSEYQLYFSRYKLSGEAVIKRLRVDTLPYGAALYPTVAVDKNGSYVIAWEQNFNGANEAAFRVFSKKNKPLTKVLAADPCAGCHKSSLQAAFRYGKIVLTWKRIEDATAALRIAYRVFGSRGAPVCDVQSVDPAGETGLVTMPRVKFISKKEFAISWIGRAYYPEEAELAGIKDSAKLYVRFFYFDGKANGKTFKAATTCCLNLASPEISVDGDALLLTWNSASAQPGGVIYASRMNLETRGTFTTGAVEIFDGLRALQIQNCRTTKLYKYFIFNNSRATGVQQANLGYAFMVKKEKKKWWKLKKSSEKKK